MLALIAKLNGITALLFHVEQWSKGVWQWRIKGSAEIYQEIMDHAYVAMIPGMEIEWRSLDGDWQDAVPHEFGESCTCQFRVTVKLPCPEASDPAWISHACANVRGFPSGWELDIPNRVLAMDGPEELVVNGRSLCVGGGQVIRAAGEFVASSDGFLVVNEGPSQVALLRVERAVLGRVPYHPSFMVVTGRLSDDEVELLKKYEPCQPKS